MIQAQAFFDEMLRQYPKLNVPALIDALYTFTHELERKSTTALNTVPSEDTETKALTFVDKNDSEIARISFTQYANANIGINFVLGEHTFTIKISDEGHIDLRSSFPLCGFSNGTDEVATAEYVINCSKANDEILENSLKEFIESTSSDLTDYVNNKVADLKDYVDGKIAEVNQNIVDTAAMLTATMKQWVKSYVPTYIENNTINYIYNAKFGPWETIVGTEGGIGDEWTWSSGARNGLLMFRVRGHVNNDLYINDTKKSRLYDGDGQGRRTVLLTIPVKSQTKYRITGSVYGPIYFAPLMLERSES